MLAPLFVVPICAAGGRFTDAHLSGTALPGVLLGGHFITWIIGRRMTLTGNANLIVNLVPVAMPFLLYFLAREKLNPRELAGTLLAVAGVAVLAGGDYRLAGKEFAGDLMCFASMVFLAAYLALGRRDGDFPTIWLYIVPLYFFGGVFCLAAAAAMRYPLAVSSLNDWTLVAGLVLIPTVLGHTIYNMAMKWFRGQIVSITGLTQFIFGAALGRLFFGEVPAWNFYAAAGLVVIGALVSLRATPPAIRRLEASAPIHTGPPAANPDESPRHAGDIAAAARYAARMSTTGRTLDGDVRGDARPLRPPGLVAGRDAAGGVRRRHPHPEHQLAERREGAGQSRRRPG